MKPYRFVENQKNSLFLSFDDGPDLKTTPKVLDLLEKHGAKASFFVIGKEADKNPSLVNEIIKAGHAIGNHSYDHSYGHFFRGKEHAKDWVLNSHDRLRQKFAVDPVGFRSPAGVVTPPMRQAFDELELDWLHWSKRFYDTSFPLSWSQPFQKFIGGDIILLHDRQKKIYEKGFILTLDNLLQQWSDKGFDFRALNAEKFTYGISRTSL